MIEIAEKVKESVEGMITIQVHRKHIPIVQNIVKNREEWTIEEDEHIIRLHKEMGKKWNSIAEKLDNGRSSSEIRSRWNNCLAKKNVEQAENGLLEVPVSLLNGNEEKNKKRRRNSTKKKKSENKQQLFHFQCCPQQYLYDQNMGITQNNY